MTMAGVSVFAAMTPVSGEEEKNCGNPLWVQVNGLVDMAGNEDVSEGVRHWRCHTQRTAL